MGIRQGQSPIEIRVDEGSTSASLYISEKQDTIQLDLESVLTLIREKRIELTPDIEARIAEIISNFKEQPRRIEETFSEATPAEHGCDAYFEWMPDMDPTAPRPLAPAPTTRDVDPDEPVNFYNISSMIRVKPDDRIAVFHEPTQGTNGRDIYGRVIEARAGKETDVTLDASVTKHDGGRITANIGGFLELKANVLRVSRLLEVEGSVDFSVGNVNFDGSVHVRDAVRDRFEVSASEDIIVEGLIEAATISAGGNFLSRRGMAGRHRGQIRIDGNAEAGFLNDIRGYVRGDLVVRREILNSDLAIGGNLASQDGVVIGGTLAVMKRARIGVVGSPGGAFTTVSLGAAPLLTAELRQCETRLQKLRSVIEQRHAMLAAMPRGRLANPATDAPVNAEVQTIKDKIAQCEAQREQITQRIRTERLLELHITKMLHAKVCLRAFDTSIVIGKPIRGPLLVTWDPEHGLHYRQGGNGAPTSLPELNR